jgi:hypothetical protein
MPKEADDTISGLLSDSFRPISVLPVRRPLFITSLRNRHSGLSPVFRHRRQLSWRGILPLPARRDTVHGSGLGVPLIGGHAHLPELSVEVILLDVLKMDVEGAEYAALQGAAGVLQEMPRPVWLVEITASVYRGQLGKGPQTQNFAFGCPNLYFSDTFELFWAPDYRVLWLWIGQRKSFLAPSWKRMRAQAPGKVGRRTITCSPTSTGPPTQPTRQSPISIWSNSIPNDAFRRRTA